MLVEYLSSLIVVFGFSAIVIYFLSKVGIPPIVGFLVGGIIIGPSGLNLVREVHEIEMLAELGVIMLMFTIGLEFSLKNLLRLRTFVLGGGAFQVFATIGATTLLSYMFISETLSQAIFNGILVSLSSTAIVFKIIMDRAEMHTPYGRISIGILIFQDLCVVLFILLLPVIAGQKVNAVDIGFTIAKAVFVVGTVLLFARWGVPWVLHEVVKTRSRELFIAAIIFFCIGTALLTSMLGLSLALGAFLAGVMISESEYAAQTVSDIVPLKESFSALFFISIGMLLNLNSLFRNALPVAVIVLIVIILKYLVAALSAYVAGQSPGNAFRAGLYLSQIGEFSFVVAITGKQAGLMAEGLYQIFLSTAVITMIATPFLISVSPAVSSRFAALPFVRPLEVMRKRRQREHYPRNLNDHVIVVGFGVNGANLAKVLRLSGIPYATVELNSETVRKAKNRGEPIYYGDGTSAVILRKIGVQSARVLVAAISDSSATRNVVRIARTENPYIYIIVRTKYLTEVDDLIRLGANEVIPEEFETSIEIFSNVLHHYHMPVNEIRDHIESIRADNYRTLRMTKLPKRQFDPTYDFVKEIHMETYRVTAMSKVIGQTLAETGLRAKTGVTVIAVKRGETMHEMPSPSFRLAPQDILVFIGKEGSIESAVTYLDEENMNVKEIGKG